jgi:hypothetical protein
MIPFEAEKDGATSGSTYADIKEQANPQLRLVLQRMIDVRGEVISAAGPVGGAEIVAVPGLDSAGPNAATTEQQVATDADGTFTLHVPASTVAIELLVFPPGYAMRMLPVTLSGSSTPEPLEIPVSPEGGTLVIQQPGTSTAAPFIAHAGSWTLLPMLLRWAQLQTPGNPRGFSGAAEIRLPNVEPGVYDLCVGAAVELRQRQGPPRDGRCVNGTLVPGGALDLRVPAGSP